MPLQKTFREAILVVGDRDEWFRRCEHAFVSQGFKSVHVDPVQGVLRGSYSQAFGPSGHLVVNVTSEGPHTRIFIRANANLDGGHGRSRRPTTKLIEKFREGLAVE